MITHNVKKISNVEHDITVASLPVHIDSVSIFSMKDYSRKGYVERFQKLTDDLESSGYDVGISAQPGLLNRHGSALNSGLFVYSADYPSRISLSNIRTRLFVEAVKDAKAAEGSTVANYILSKAPKRLGYNGLDAFPVWGESRSREFISQYVQKGPKSDKQLVRLDSSVLDDNSKMDFLNAWNNSLGGPLLFALEANSNHHKDDYPRLKEQIRNLPDSWGFFF